MRLYIEAPQKDKLFLMMVSHLQGFFDELPFQFIENPNH